MLLWSLGLGAAAGAIGILFANNDITWRIIGTMFITSAAALLMLPMSGWIDKAKSRPAGLFGMCFVVGEYLLINMAMWEVLDVFLPGNRDWALISTIFALVLPGFFTMAMLRLMHVKGGAIASWAGLAVAAMVTAAFLWAAWLPSPYPRDGDLWETGWTIGGYGVLAVCSLHGLGADRGR